MRKRFLCRKDPKSLYSFRTMTVYNVRDTIGMQKIKKKKKKDYRNPDRPRLGVTSCEQKRVPAHCPWRGIPVKQWSKKSTDQVETRNRFCFCPLF